MAGYAPSNASHQASELLRRPDVAARVAELQGEYFAQQASKRAEATDALLGKLEPVYDAAFGAGDFDTAMQSVELQARIMGLVHGGATLRPRSGTGKGEEYDPSAGHMEFLDSLEED
jgi:phage terminase small subunit